MSVDFSIVVPVYNAEKWLKRCIHSIRHQSFTNYEVILVNDGSQDASESICLKYAEEDSRVVYIKQKNQGVSVARNNGIKHSTGEYIVFLNNDDYLNTECLKIIKENVSEEPDIVMLEYREVTSKEDIDHMIKTEFCTVKTTLLENQGEYLQKELLCPIDSSLRGISIVFPWGKAYKKSFLLDNNLLFDSDIKLCEDVYCQTAHCGRLKPHFDFGGNTSPTVPYRHLPQALRGLTADCRSLV